MTVNTLGDTIDADPNVTSLHEAILAVNNSTDWDNKIDLAVQGQIFLSKALPAITLANGGQSPKLTITGPGRDKLSVERSLSATTDFRIFKTGDKADVTITGLTIARGQLLGSGPGDFSGGGVYVGFSLTLTDCAVKLNQASGDGGGIYVEGDAWLKLVNTVVQSNQGGNGGGIAVSGASVEAINQPRVDIKQSSQVIDNVASGAGGGIYVAAAFATRADTLRIADSLVAQNKAQLTGGGLYLAAGENMVGKIAKSEFLGNLSVTGSGGAFFTGVRLVCTDSSFDGNRGGAASGYAIAVDATFETAPVAMINCSVSNNRYLPPPSPPGVPPPPPLPSSAVDTGTGKIEFTSSVITGNDGNGVRGTVVSGGSNWADNSATSSTGWQDFPIDIVT